MEEPEKHNPFFVMMEEMQANSNLTEEEADALAEEAVQAVRNANKIRSQLLQSIVEEAQANSDLEAEEAERLVAEEIKALRSDERRKKFMELMEHSQASSNLSEEEADAFAAELVRDIRKEEAETLAEKTVREKEDRTRLVELLEKGRNNSSLTEEEAETLIAEEIKAVRAERKNKAK